MHFLKKIIYLLCIYLSLFYVREISSGLHAIHPPPPPPSPPFSRISWPSRRGAVSTFSNDPISHSVHVESHLTKWLTNQCSAAAAPATWAFKYNKMAAAIMIKMAFIT